MIRKPIDVLHRFPVRKSKQQKEEFRRAVGVYVQDRGYVLRQERGSFGAQNLVIGNPQTAKYLVTAHYDTPASIGIPNFLIPFNPFTYILYQLIVVALFFAISIPIGLLVAWLTRNEMMGFAGWYISYFGVLFLMMLGPANRHNANDNTSGVVTVLEILDSLPENMRDRVCFILFDLEEAGLIGSASYRKAHKAQTENQIVLNLDCVGDGDHIFFFPVKKAKKNDVLLEKLGRVCGSVGNKEICLRHKGFTAGNSDHKNFPNGVGVMAFHKAKLLGLYCDRIHTWRDKILDQTNVNILRAAIITLICQ